MAYEFLIPIGFVVVFVTIVILAVIAEKKRNELFSSFAQRRGFQYEKKGDKNYLDIFSLGGIGHTKIAKRMIKGRSRGKRIEIFDYSYTVGGGRSSRTIVQTVLKTSLEKQEFEVIHVGRIRGHKEHCPKGHSFLSFKEKGVDVRIAVDMVGMAHNKELKLAIIASSDSDLQPAITELKNNSIERIYLGLEDSPNKGLTYTTNRTILIRNSELEEFLGKKLI